MTLKTIYEERKKNSMLPNNMVQKEPREKLKGRIRQPKYLNDEKLKVLLNTPNTWYVIATLDKWASGVVSNIQNMKQKNIEHLSDKGKFEVKQRLNEDKKVEIYCRFVPL